MRPRVSIQIHGLILDRGRSIASIGSRILPLTGTEFSILEFMALHAGAVVSREQITREIWGIRGHIPSNVIDVHIKNLRKKIQSRKSPEIETIRGKGYRLG